MEMNLFASMKSDSAIWNPSVSVTVSSSSFSSVLISTTFFASSVIESTLELLDSTFFNISAKQNASMQDQKPNSCSITISNSAFNRVYGVYDGVLIPSISADAHSLDNFNTTHISCSRWDNKHYTNETLERVVLDHSVDKEFTFDSCTWMNIMGDESGQCIFARTQDLTVLTVDVINCKFQNCTSYVGSGGAIFVTGNVAVTIENSSFQDINGENENINVETTAGAVHIISIRSPAIKQCLFFNCSSKADACVIFEHRATKIPQRKTDFCGNHAIWHQNNYSQIRERNNFPFEGNDKKMQTKWNYDKEESFEKTEPVFVQCTFLRCYSQRSGGGLYLKDVEEQVLVSECDFSGCKSDYGGAIYVVVADTIFLKANKRSFNQSLFCIYASYFAVNTADKYGHDVFVVSEADYDDGSKLFSKSKISEQKEGAVAQMRRSKPDEILFLTKSLEVTRRNIELDSTANYNAACGSSTKLPCQNIFQALTHVTKSEDMKFSIASDAKTTNFESSVLFKGAFYQSNYVAVRNVTSNLITTVTQSGGFVDCSLYDRTYFAITNSSFKSCSAVESGGALSISILKDASLILDQLSFFNNSAKKYRDVQIFTHSLLDFNIQRIFSFVDESVDGTQIGCFDIWYSREGISIKEFLSVYSNSTIFVSSSRGVDFARCGTFNLPCRSLSYGWAHLDEPRRLIVVDLAYLTLPSILEKAEICSSTELGIAGKVEVNVKYSSSWREVILLNGSVKFEGLNLVLHPMTSNTKNAITVIRGASLWIKMIISFSSITEEQSIDYLLFNIEGGDVTFDNLSIKGDKTLITTALFNIVPDADLLQLNDVSLENVKIKHDMISVSPNKSSEKEKMSEQRVLNILISNLSFIKMNDLTDSERSSGNAEEILGGLLLRSRESARQKLELHNSSLSGFMSPDDFEPYGGCIHWREKKRDGKYSSTIYEDDEPEESSELLFKNCTFCNDGLDTQLHEKETKGGAVYLAFHSQTFPFAFQEVALFQNKANIGRDIFIRCPNVSNKKESEKFGINFYHPLWKEQNSIEAESEEEGKVVDYLEFLTYRNSNIYVSGYDSSVKNCRTEQTSTFSSHSSSNNSQRISDGYGKQESGWDIFFCGSKDDPCSTVNYAMTHLTSPTPSISQKVLIPFQRIPDFIRKMQIFGDEDKDEHLTLRIVGEPSIFDSVTWNSLSVEGEADRAGLLFEKSEQEVNKRQGIKQKSKLCKCNEQMDIHVVIKGNCRMNNTNIKITANLPVSCLFLIDDEGTFGIERCTISSLNELMIIPTTFKIEAGTLLSKEKSSYESSTHNHFTESTSLFSTTSYSSNISSIRQTSSSSYINLNTSSHDEKSSIPLHVPLKTKLEGDIYTENSYLSIDPGSFKGNSVEFEAFPRVAHNIICKSDTAQENDDKGAIELIRGAGSSINFESKIESEKSRIDAQSSRREEKITEELPDSFWIENNNCSLVGFTSDMMSSLFTPQPVSISSAKSGEGYEVTLTGECLLNYNLLMVLLANQTNAGKFTDELAEIAVTNKLNCSNENAVCAIFPLDAMERADGSDEYVVPKFSTKNAFNKDLTTIPLRVSEGNNSGVVDDMTMIIMIAVSAAVVGVGFAVALFFVRRWWKKKMLLTEYEERKSLLSSVNSDFQRGMRRKEENTNISSYVSDYGTTTKQIDIPSDSRAFSRGVNLILQ
ncbi:uncharacterized protein MONOS_11284 [Monocercomonoides exilis]|uniref:uncharacterized protein n=1 Tax=Monocercomonoides exilis TaxID=2049356 RepID=UPI003559F258|nr:hypothetical protein MONOS_11284 [Monocercomonoides exilis]|eukprot:MONOS_11284.1-p1 / transcript=MONOS_11284.1 / gene=MONOS_11284 / organism=Monocercomonoides_exilis_PA203 / gene_product=unspecified product / transcript_product=unspecified product / location=Mono_scaffold00558:22636-28563(+) / protein_length=1682 / sequence_SO=supercontig / SO=protein_coding / is_pseudo=false